MHHQHWSWIEGENENPPPKILKTQSSPSASSETNIVTEAENSAFKTWQEGATNALRRIVMTCESNVEDQIQHMKIPSEVWKKLENMYKPCNLYMQFDYLSTIRNILDDYPRYRVLLRD